jgi:hypothetical protein
MNIIISDFPPVSTFELCDPSGVKEEDFTDLALRVLQRLRPDCTLFPFHPKVFHDDAVWTPDLAVVDREFSYWFVVEVETATHHLEKHVIPQVTAFCEGRYDSSAAYMLAESLRVGVQQAETLLATIPRDVVVVSNKRDEQWNRKLAALGVQHLVIETYRNKTTAQALYRIDGDLLPVHRSLGFGRVRLRDGVVVTQATDHWTEGRVTIHGPDGAAIWICSIVDGRAWLMKEQGLIEFQNEAIIQFLRRHDGTLIVRLPYLK